MALDDQLMMRDIRKNVLKNAPPGGGDRYDMVVKQIATDREEFEFLCELMGGEPAMKIFMYREPNGWLPSAKEKFGYNEKEGLQVYTKSLAAYKEIGGATLEYHENLQKELAALLKIKEEQLDSFSIKRVKTETAPEAFIEQYCGLTITVK